MAGCRSPVRWAEWQRSEADGLSASRSLGRSVAAARAEENGPLDRPNPSGGEAKLTLTVSASASSVRSPAAAPRGWRQARSLRGFVSGRKQKAGTGRRETENRQATRASVAAGAGAWVRAARTTGNESSRCRRALPFAPQRSTENIPEGRALQGYDTIPRSAVVSAPPGLLGDFSGLRCPSWPSIRSPRSTWTQRAD